MKKLFEKYQNMPVQVRAAFWFLVCSFMQKGISVITTPIFTRLLSTTDYGQYNVFNSWLSILTIFVTLNLAGGVYAQGLIKFSDERKEFSSSLQGLVTVLTALWTVVYLVNRPFWNELLSLTTTQVLAMLVMMWATSAFSFWAAEKRVEYQYRALVLVTVLVSIAKPALGIVLVCISEDKVTARILGLVLVELVAYTGLYLSQMLRGKKFVSWKFWKYAMAFNLPLIPHYLSQSVLSSADRIMIERMTNASDAGIYSLAYAISLLMTLFNSALTQTISPWMYQKIKAKQTEDIAPIAYITMCAIALVNLLLIAMAPEAVAIFAPEKYREAIWVIPPVAMSVFFLYCYDLFAKFAFYYEKTGVIMAVSVAGAVLNVVLNYIFIGIYGYVAAAYTTLVCYMLYCGGHYLLMNRVCDDFCDGIRPYSTKKILGITAVFLAAGFVLLFTYKQTLVRYGIFLVALVVLYVKRRVLLELVKQVLAVKKKRQ